jgi:glucose/arabinose dehydrogenase/regulation of enolase protein 1 (concanavalin A-like superfamily)
MEFAPDGRLFVCQQGGQVRVIKNGALLGTPFLTAPVDGTGERGLLGIAFDPNFAANRYVYVYYTATSPAIHNRVSRFTANGDVAVAGSEVVLLNLNNLSGASNHNGGAIHFGADGKLYIAVGENANPANAQSLNNLLGKMLRLNADGSIPTDNPFYNTASGLNRAIWALGLRNPFTFAVQPGTGRIFINDVGQDTWEEIDDGAAGANFGWPNCEGDCSPANSNYRNPIFRYQHGSGSTSGYCIAGGAFYNPATVNFPASYVGDYFFADYVNGWIRGLDPANGNQVTGFATGINAPVDLKVGSDGRLYYLARGSGAVYAIRYTASQAPQITQQPAAQTVYAGQAATFTVAASGTAPLSYQWQRNNGNISGATTTAYTLASTSVADDGALFRCIVANASGSVTSSAALLRVSTNGTPAANITLPANGALFNAGDTIQYSGTGTDPEDGNLAANRFSWTVIFHHDTHTHPFLGPINGTTSGSFVVPTQGETATNIWYRIQLTVTDSAGQAQTTFRDIRPRTTTISLTTIPAGLQLTLDGQPTATPTAMGSVVGMSRALGVVSPQSLNGTNYEFVSWSDGGAALHTVTTPGNATTYTATFRAVGAGVLHYDFTYPDRTSLLGAGWDFLARTAGGATRNTEQTTGRLVDYNQSTHPGVLRIPVDVGDLWNAENNSRNSIFRNLPADWSSVRVKLAFAPTQNYQQAGIVVYQDDDNYVNVTREFNTGNKVALVRESGGTASTIAAPSVSATSNLHLRLDRDTAGRISGSYSLNGTSWTALGNVTQTINNPRLGIFVGASPGGYPNADISWVEIVSATSGSPVLSASPSMLTFTTTAGNSPASQSIAVANTGVGTMNWTAVPSAGTPAWLTVSPTSGSGNGTITVSVSSAALAAGTYSKTVTVTAPGATNSPQTIAVNLTVNPATGANSNHYDFNYSNRSSLLAAGWDYLARTATGVNRNTEQITGAIPDFNQSTHPGVLRIPADVGDLWGSVNNTRNSLFRDVPANWISLRLKLAFAPTQNYQQAGLVVYQNDDNYVQITRIFNGDNKISFARELAGAGAVLASAAVTTTANLHLRVDRDLATGRISGSYSSNGTSWTTVGSGVVQTVNNPRLGIIIGASPGGFPNADLAWAEVITAASGAAPPAGDGVLQIVAPSLTDNRFSFLVPTQPGVSYAIEYKNNWSDSEWLPLETVIGTGELISVEDAAIPGASRFYRVRRE